MHRVNSLPLRIKARRTRNRLLDEPDRRYTEANRAAVRSSGKCRDVKQVLYGMNTQGA